jgi:hypothetical protein
LDPLLNMLVACGVAPEKVLFVGTKEKWAGSSGKDEELYPSKFLYRLGAEQETSLSGERTKKGRSEWRSETRMNYMHSNRLLVWNEQASGSQEEALRLALQEGGTENIVLTGEGRADTASIQTVLSNAIGTAAGSSVLDLTMDDALLTTDPESKFEHTFTALGAEGIDMVIVAFDCTNVTSTTLEPSARLRECISDQDQLVVKLAAVLDGCFTAALKVKDNLPDFNAFNLYSEKAYDHAEKIRKFRKCGSGTLKRFLPPLAKAELEASKSMRYKVFTDDDTDLVESKGLQETRAEKSHMDAERLHKDRQLLGFRASMADSFDNMGGMNSDGEQEDLLMTVVQHECGKMHFQWTERDECQAVFKQHLNLLSKAFRYYCGVSGGDGGGQGLGAGTATMNHSEFVAFISRCKLMPKLEDRALVDDVFLKSDSGQGAECGDVEHELLRHEFMEGLLRMGLEKFPEATESVALQQIMEQYIVPQCSPLLDDPVKALYSEGTTQMKFIDNAKKLLLVYNRYSSKDGDGETTAGGRPTMNMKEFFELMMDSALLDGYHAADADGVAVEGRARSVSASSNTTELTTKEARMAFAQAQGDMDEMSTELDELVYSEFLEAVIRIALAKWEGDGIPNQVKIDLAIKSITTLARFNYRSAKK